MSALMRVWNHFEEAAIAFLLGAMTLVTCTYVLLNNLYTVFYWLADRWEGGSELMFAIGDFIIGYAQAMTWSPALTKALFGWLIFLGMAYGVRTAGHIGVDALVKLAPRGLQKVLGLIAVCACIAYSLLMAGGSYAWVSVLFKAGIGAEDLDHFGILQGHIALIVPFGFGLMALRFGEIFLRIVRNEQTGLGLADEAADALKHMDEEAKP